MVDRTIDKALDFIETYVCGLLFAAMCIIIFLQIVLRATGLPLAWTEETARYLFVWIIYIAASKAVKNSKHLSVDLLSITLKGKAQRILTIFTNIVSLFFFVILCYYGCLVIQKMTVHPQFSAANGYNMIFPYSAPLIGSFLMSIRAVQNTLRSIRKPGNSSKEVSTE